MVCAWLSRNVAEWVLDEVICYRCLGEWVLVLDDVVCYRFLCYLNNTLAHENSYIYHIACSATNNSFSHFATQRL